MLHILFVQRVMRNFLFQNIELLAQLARLLFQKKALGVQIQRCVVLKLGGGLFNSQMVVGLNAVDVDKLWCSA
jgi:hypothetical protein